MEVSSVQIQFSDLGYTHRHFQSIRVSINQRRRRGAALPGLEWPLESRPGIRYVPKQGPTTDCNHKYLRSLIASRDTIACQTPVPDACAQHCRSGSQSLPRSEHKFGTGLV